MNEQQETVAHVPVSDATLKTVGAERLFQLYTGRIAECMIDQTEGRRASGDIKFTLTVTIGMREEGVRFHSVGQLKEPGYTGSAVVGHMAPAGDGKVQLRIVNPNPQAAFAFPAQAERDDQEGAHPYDTPEH